MAVTDIIKRPFRSFDGTKWLKHYFETSADQVKFGKANGTESNVQTELTQLITELGKKASASHSHNYAGSASAGGSAISAVKLDTSAGSATKPVYFSGGKPVACSYSLGASVPNGAKFTDTNTWRPVDNTLESQATDRSLSAKMGYLLNQNLGNINRDLGNRAHMYRISWGKSLTIPGLAHGIIIVANHTIYGVWVAGSAGAYELSKLFLHGYDTLTFSCNRTTGAVTVTCKETSGITYIGA